jgi:Arc/MetJ-type ribon-helix-helix transcriptional regulator
VSQPNRYEATITLRVPVSFRPVLAKAAAGQFMSQSTYVRQALHEKLERDGFRAAPGERSDVTSVILTDGAQEDAA